MKALIVHNSDEVKACFIGETEEEIVKKVMDSAYHDDIMERLNDGVEEEEDAVTLDEITMDNITSLCHDGDSEDGYTLIDVI